LGVAKHAGAIRFILHVFSSQTLHSPDFSDVTFAISASIVGPWVALSV